MHSCNIIFYFNLSVRDFWMQFRISCLHFPSDVIVIVFQIVYKSRQFG